MARSREDRDADLSALDAAERTLRTQRAAVRESLDVVQGAANLAQVRQGMVRMMRLQLATVRFVLVLAGRSTAQDRDGAGEA
jgi:hypothetical protein